MIRTRGTRGDDEIIRAEWDDSLPVQPDFDDLIRAGNGDDLIRSRDGNDIAHGCRGNDVVDGGVGNDFLYGDRGNDLLFDNVGFNRLEGATGNDTISTFMGFGAINSMVGGRGADVFALGWHESQQWSLAAIEDFRPEQGDRISMQVLIPPTPESVTPEFPFGIGTQLGTAEAFDLFDSNDDGRMDDADDAVVQHGADLHFALPNGTVILSGVDHLDWSMLI